jgi:hypothetical protein
MLTPVKLAVVRGLFGTVSDTRGRAAVARPTECVVASELRGSASTRATVLMVAFDTAGELRKPAGTRVSD